MEYRDEDRWLFGPDQTSNRAEGWSIICWLVSILILAALLGCDFQAAEATNESVMVAYEKRQALVGIPCATWICQKSFDHEPCGRSSNTACAASADLTERTK